MHCYAFRRPCLQCLTGQVQPGCSTRPVSRTEVVAAPPHDPAVQLPAAFKTHAEDVALRLLQPAGIECHSSGGQRQCLETEDALCCLVASPYCDLWHVAIVWVPRIFSPLILQGSLGDALHNPQTLKYLSPSICRNNN